MEEPIFAISDQNKVEKPCKNNDRLSWFRLYDALFLELRVHTSSTGSTHVPYKFAKYEHLTLSIVRDRVNKPPGIEIDLLGLHYTAKLSITVYT